MRGFAMLIAATACLSATAATLPEFPPNSVWRRDVSSVPLNANSTAMLNHLQSLGGWGTGATHLQIDFSFYVLHANSGIAATPVTPLGGVDSYYYPDCGDFHTPLVAPKPLPIPLPPGGGIEGTGPPYGASQPSYSCDNNNEDQQAIIAVRDDGTTHTQADMVQQFLHETVVPTGEPNAGATLRCVTGSSDNDCTTAINSITAGDGGWYVNLYTTDSSGIRSDAGERVVVNPGAIFASNTVIFESLITGAQNSDACDPSTQGAILALNATTGGSAGVSSLGGPPIAGGRINNARTSGSLPVASALGGGKIYLPGTLLAPAGTPIAIDAPIWRRRAWRELMNDQ